MGFDQCCLLSFLESAVPATQSLALWLGTANDEIVVLRKPTVNRWLGLG